METVLEFMGNIVWWRVIWTLFFTAIAIVLGIWVPAKALEYHTRQPMIKWMWYVVGSFALVSIFISLYGYGHFWELYGERKFEIDRSGPVEPKRDNISHVPDNG